MTCFPFLPWRTHNGGAKHPVFAPRTGGAKRPGTCAKDQGTRSAKYWNLRQKAWDLRLRSHRSRESR